MHLGLILVSNQLDAQFSMYVYFYFLLVSGSHTRRSSAQSDINQVSHWYNNSPDDGHTAARNMQRREINIHEKMCVKLVIYKDSLIDLSL